jgi:Restriction endonuclease S subunits
MAWKTFRLKNLVSLVVVPADAGDDLPYVGLEAIEPWTGKIDLGVKDTDEQTSVGNRFLPGDVLFGKLRPYLAKVAAPDFSGQCTGEALVLRPKSGVDTRFIRYRLVEAGIIDSVNASTFGAKMPRASWQFMGNLRFPVPEFNTQQLIADFLDRETALIDQLSEKKQRFIQMTADGLAATIDLTLSPSNVPKAELVPFKWICRVAEGQVDPTDPRWADKPLIAPNHIESGTGRLLGIESAAEQGAISGKYAYSAGTVLYSKIRPALAKACIAPDAGMCSADMYPIIPSRELRPEFLLMQLLSRKFTTWATLESMRVAMPKINRSTLGDYRLWVPSLQMQDEMLSAHQRQKKHSEAMIDKQKESLSRLSEFRSALITAAVTGQIDVTTWGKQGQTARLLDKIQEEMGA